MNTERIGVFSADISYRFSAMACACPRSSAPMPQYAPEVSTKQTIGRRNFSASFMPMIAHWGQVFQLIKLVTKMEIIKITKIKLVPQRG